jgi:hypothetical protein
MLKNILLYIMSWSVKFHHSLNINITIKHIEVNSQELAKAAIINT